MINVLADKYIYDLNSFLPNDVNLQLYDPQQPFNTVAPGTNALLTRTTTKIDTDFINRLPSSLQFIATASAGTDHVDTIQLRKQDIAFTNAPGCNARAVAEYIATAMLLWTEQKNVGYKNLTVGVIGVGNAGEETSSLLNKLGITTVEYDPPRANRETKFQSASLHDILGCDILTFHTPLTFVGNNATHHWLDEKKLQHRFALIINASRGGVVNENTLLNAYQNNRVDDYILDVWENEPVFSDDIAQNAFIHTPHIAGYSVQAKLNASNIVAQTLCKYFNLQQLRVESFHQQNVKNVQDVSTLDKLLSCLHPIKTYHQKFYKLIGQSSRKKKNGFGTIRTTHPLRNEYRHLRLPNNIEERFPIFETLRKEIQ